MDIFNTKRIDQLEKRFETLINDLSDYLEEEYANEFDGRINNRVGEVNKKLTKTLETISDSVSGLERRIESMEEEMEGYKNYKTEKDLLKESDKPWSDFEIGVTDDGRVKVKMDWNKAFIKLLKENGFNSSSEEEMVSTYFSSLVREHGDELSEEDAIKRMSKE